MKKAASSLVILLILTAAVSILAQEKQRGFSVQNFQNTPGSDGFLTVEGATVPLGLSLRFGAVAA